MVVMKSTVPGLMQVVNASSMIEPKWTSNCSVDTCVSSVEKLSSKTLNTRTIHKLRLKVSTYFQSVYWIALQTQYGFHFKRKSKLSPEATLSEQVILHFWPLMKRQRQQPNLMPNPSLKPPLKRLLTNLQVHPAWQLVYPHLLVQLEEEEVYQHLTNSPKVNHKPVAKEQANLLMTQRKPLNKTLNLIPRPEVALRVKLTRMTSNFKMLWENQVYKKFCQTECTAAVSKNGSREAKAFPGRITWRMWVTFF